ncbi:MAG: type-F conjugative transfer system protein TrbI [Alphaproteobacteria bacterium]|nr:type-F conjugative transfer system protein TrbI [Alphaproteobacteria bacterium]
MRSPLLIALFALGVSFAALGMAVLGLYTEQSRPRVVSIDIAGINSSYVVNAASRAVNAGEDTNIESLERQIATVRKELESLALEHNLIILDRRAFPAGGVVDVTPLLRKRLGIIGKEGQLP